MGCIACSQLSNKRKDLTLEKIVEGCGISLPQYKIINTNNDNDLLEGDWRQQGWILELEKKLDNNILDSLVVFDDRWCFQNDARQQYYFYDKASETESREIYIGKGDDFIISICYEWKK